MVDITSIFPFSESLGYLGLLIISFVSSAIPFVSAPFFVILATLSIDPKFNLQLLALTSAIGATGGKMVIFYGSYYGRKILADETKRRMRPLQKLVSRYGWIAAFVAASTPVPDDLVYIPLGLSKYNPMKFLAATFAGKVVLSEAVVLVVNLLGLQIIEPYLEYVPDPTTFYVYLGIFSTALTVVIIYMLRIDWSKNIGKWFPWTMKDDEDDGKNNAS